MSLQSSLLYAFPLWLCALLAGCTEGMYGSIPTGTEITPEYFQFVEMIPEEELGGWQAVCVMATVGQRTMHTQNGPVTSSQITCPIEVGVPISNKKRGFIPVEEAQRVSAKVANETAYKVLHENPDAPMAAICQKIITEMNIALYRALSGSKVTRCGATKWKKPLPTVVWPNPMP